MHEHPIHKVLQKIKSDRWLKVVLLAAFVAISAIAAKPSAVAVFKSYAQAEGAKRKLPVYCVETAEKKIAISFDAAWGADDTDNLLQILKDEDIKATFFLCGYWVDKYPDEVKKIFEAGHDIGNHGATHAHGAQLSVEQNMAEIEGAHQKIKNLLGIDMKLFRPPFGEYNNNVITAAENLGYYTIQWDVDTFEIKMENIRSLFRVVV